jgi:hypothetical protein
LCEGKRCLKQILVQNLSSDEAQIIWNKSSLLTNVLAYGIKATDIILLTLKQAFT